jgi:serine/threonine protein kinase
MLSGTTPFDGENDNEILAAITAGEYKFHKRFWRGISEEAKEFVSLMLQKDPANRISI